MDDPSSRLIRAGKIDGEDKGFRAQIWQIGMCIYIFLN